MEDCNEALRLKPNNATALDHRGLAYLKLGQPDQAIVRLRRGAQAQPELAGGAVRPRRRQDDEGRCRRQQRRLRGGQADQAEHRGRVRQASACAPPQLANRPVNQPRRASCAYGVFALGSTTCARVPREAQTAFAAHSANVLVSSKRAVRGGHGMDELERAIRDLVIANRILAQGGRGRRLRPRQHPASAQARPLSALALAQPGAGHERRHHRIHARRHAGQRHAPAAISSASSTARSTRRGRTSTPWSIPTPRTCCRSASRATPMCCVAHVASDMGNHVPVWDIADKFGDATNLLVINMAQGRDMAHALGEQQRRADARPRLLGGGRRLAQGWCGSASICRATRACCSPPCGSASSRRCPRTRSRPATGFKPNSPEMQRAWEYWAKRAGCADMLAGS